MTTNIRGEEDSNPLALEAREMGCDSPTPDLLVEMKRILDEGIFLTERIAGNLGHDVEAADLARGIGTLLRGAGTRLSALSKMTGEVFDEKLPEVVRGPGDQAVRAEGSKSPGFYQS